MRQYRFDAKPPEFLLTHPVTESRIADTRNRAEQSKPGGKEDSLRYQLIRARVQLQYEDTSGLAAKRFQAQLDENPKNDVARYGLAIAQIKGSQFKQARENLTSYWPRHRTTLPITWHRSSWRSTTIICRMPSNVLIGC